MSRISSKKAQGLSLSTVIIAIIVLVVLVVLVMVFTGGIQKFFVHGVKQCDNSGGKCSTATDCAADDDNIIETYNTASDSKAAGCADKVNQVCCKKAFFSSS